MQDVRTDSVPRRERHQLPGCGPVARDGVRVPRACGQRGRQIPLLEHREGKNAEKVETIPN